MVLQIRRWRAAALALAFALTPLLTAPAQAANCHFVLGFATLAQLIPLQVGQCLDDEQHNPANGDALQHTTGGLLVWRKADNHTAFTDGTDTWVNGPHGLEERGNGTRFPWEPNPEGLPVVGDNPVHPATLPAPNLDTILFADTTHGWAGGSGLIVATSNGGATWTTEYRGLATITQLDFLNDSAGFALGQQELLRTADGGATWQPTAEPPQPLAQVHFLSPATGYGVADGTLYRTTDGGGTWRPLPTPIAAGSMCFVNPDTGWIVNEALDGRPLSTLPATALYATTDGGATWQAAALPDTVTQFAGLAQTLQCAPPGVLWDLFVGEPGAGNEFYALYRGATGGAAWRLVAGHELPVSAGAAGPEPGPYAGALSVVSADAAFLTGWCGACYPPSPPTPPAVALGGTTDRGQTWRDYPVPGLPPVATAIAFLTADRGWLVAEGGSARPSQILATGDGGRTWRTQYTVGPTASN
jgi:photosystem II stability/assembly factor-like uncharacterized protein